ncbi:MAG: 30S ribosomal protein S9 [bacterium]
MVEKVAEYCASGRRKTAVARVCLTPGTGKWIVNKKDPNIYFGTEAVVKFIEQPMKLTDSREKFDLTASLTGGGIVGQAGALRHAISRALVVADASLRKVLKSSGCMTRDSRMKERKKYGQPGARKRFQFSKR